MYMKKLLSMIKDKVNERNCDITMKFTLSALWNLTGLLKKFLNPLKKIELNIFLLNYIL